MLVGGGEWEPGLVLKAQELKRLANDGFSFSSLFFIIIPWKNHHRQSIPEPKTRDIIVRSSRDQEFLIFIFIFLIFSYW